MNPETSPSSADTDASTTSTASTTTAATTPTPRRGLARFALNTLLILGVVGFFAALIIPTCGHRHPHSTRSVDSSNLRQIGQASLIYASDSQDQLPQVDDIHAFAFELARLGGLNDGTIWFARADTEAANATRVSTVLSADRKNLEPAFAASRPSFAAAVRGLKVTDASTTPIAWTRGLRPDGTWAKDSPYGGEGGHVVFLGGNVTFFRNTKDAFVGRDGRPVTDIREALPPGAVIANN